MEEDGEIISDMLCHWQYVIQNLFGDIKALTCLGATHVKERVDESGKTYKCTADDSAYATFELTNGVIAHFNSSWCVRVRRDDLLCIQVDGTKGSAVAGLRYGSPPDLVEHKARGRRGIYLISNSSYCPQGLYHPTRKRNTPADLEPRRRLYNHVHGWLVSRPRLATVR